MHGPACSIHICNPRAGAGAGQITAGQVCRCARVPTTTPRAGIKLRGRRARDGSRVYGGAGAGRRRDWEMFQPMMDIMTVVAALLLAAHAPLADAGWHPAVDCEPEAPCEGMAPCCMVRHGPPDQ
eukprot:SAG25_NODE_7299_length_489_cov_1.433333_1_plen_124_part_10